MSSHTKQELEQMLKLLDLSTLEAIDSNVRRDHYLYGQRPLLKYTSEAITEYATAIYSYILPHFGSTGSITIEQYVEQWLSPYRTIQEQLDAKAEDFICRLRAIATTPEPQPELPPHLIAPKECLYTKISDFLDGKDDFYVDVFDFIFNVYSPLRKPTVTDSRVLALVTEADKLCGKASKKLTSLIDKELIPLRKPLKQRLNYYKLSKKNVALLHTYQKQIPVSAWIEIKQALDNKVITSATKKMIKAQLKYIKSATGLSDTDRIKLHEISESGHVTTDADRAKALHLSRQSADWELDSQNLIKAFEDNNKTILSSPAYANVCKDISTAKRLLAYLKSSITPEEHKFLSNSISTYSDLATIKTEEDAKTLIKRRKDLYAVTIDVHELFIRSLLKQLEIEYSELRPKDKNSESIDVDVEDIMALIVVSRLVDSKGMDYEALEDQQAVAELWYLNFEHVKEQLKACLQISLNNLLPSSIFVPEVLEHGAITGMMEWAKQVKVLLASTPLVLNCTALAEQLHHQLKQHTISFALGDPLPEVNPLTKEQQLNASTTVPTLDKASAFDLTVLIQRKIDSLALDSAFTQLTAIDLSDNEVQALTPVPDRTIALLCAMTVRQPCTPLMLDGSLLIHLTDVGQYYKVVPEIRVKGYAQYIFVAFNWTLFTDTLIKLEELVNGESEPVPNLYKDGNYTVLEQIKHCESCYWQVVGMFDELCAKAEAMFKDTELESYAYSLTNTWYYGNCYISGHRLSAWVYYPEEYRLISEVQVNSNGKIVDYEPDHINRVCSDNRPENLQIVPKKTNVELRSTSIPVNYTGRSYATLKKYCDETDAGNYSNLQQNVKDLEFGSKVKYNGRTYELDANGDLLANDVNIVPPVLFNDVPYESITAFADSVKLSAPAVRQALSRAKKAGKTDFSCKLNNKKYQFLLGVEGNVQIKA